MLLGIDGVESMIAISIGPWGFERDGWVAVIFMDVFVLNAPPPCPIPPGIGGNLLDLFMKSCLNSSRSLASFPKSFEANFFLIADQEKCFL
jgi:hypothetical protein